MAKIETGVVKWFDDTRGYGFIARESGGDVFVHASEAPGGSLKPGDEVEFEVSRTSKGPKAKSIRLLGKSSPPIETYLVEGESSLCRLTVRQIRGMYEVIWEHWITKYTQKSAAGWQVLSALIACDSNGLFYATRSSRRNRAQGKETFFTRDLDYIVRRYWEHNDPGLHALWKIVEEGGRADFGDGYFLVVEDTGEVVGGKSIYADDPLYNVWVNTPDGRTIEIARGEQEGGLIFKAFYEKFVDRFVER